MKRRAFLGSLPALGLIVAGCGGGSRAPAQPSAPVSPPGVRGFVRSVFDDQPVDPFRITIGSASAASTGGAFSLSMPPGTYDVLIEGAGLLVPRFRRGVEIADGADLVLDALPAGRPFDADHFRRIALGIGSNTAYNSGGRSRRFRGARIDIVAVRSPGAPDLFCDIVREAAAMPADASRGRIAATFAVSDQAPSPAPDATIVVRWWATAPVCDGRHVCGRPDRVDGEHILTASADVTGLGTSAQSRDLLVAQLAHELGHCIGLDDSTDVRSFMWYPTGVPAGAGQSMSAADADAVQLKYSRRAGATFGERDAD